VWTFLYGQGLDFRGRSSISFQAYMLESMRQARMFNPGLPFFLLTDDAGLLFRERPAWQSLLAEPHFSVQVVDVALLRDWQLQHLEQRMRDIWGPLAAELSNMMLPSQGGGLNWVFSTVTLTRFVYLHHWMRASGRARVLHVENDQMLYGSALEVAGAAEACGLDFVLGRVAAGRYAASVLYVSSAEAGLAPFLAFLWASLSSGWQHAAAVCGSLWVTDMSLTAAFVDAAAAAGLSNVTVFPSSSEPGSSCLSRALPVVVDGAALGSWCCGDMGRGRSFFEVRTEFSDESLWDWPFEWRVQPFTAVPVRLVAGDAAERSRQLPAVPAAPAEPGSSSSSSSSPKAWVTVSGGSMQGRGSRRSSASAPTAPVLRVPIWNGSRVFNLHIHSKMLHWWRSDDAAVPWGDLLTAGEVGELD
jgi:hypothetical protein